MAFDFQKIFNTQAISSGLASAVDSGDNSLANTINELNDKLSYDEYLYNEVYSTVNNANELAHSANPNFNPNSLFDGSFQKDVRQEHLLRSEIDSLNSRIQTLDSEYEKRGDLDSTIASSLQLSPVLVGLHEFTSNHLSSYKNFINRVRSIVLRKPVKTANTTDDSDSHVDDIRSQRESVTGDLGDDIVDDTSGIADDVADDATDAVGDSIGDIIADIFGDLF